MKIRITWSYILMAVVAFAVIAFFGLMVINILGYGEALDGACEKMNMKRTSINHGNVCINTSNNKGYYVKVDCTGYIKQDCNATLLMEV